jgi:hypothetical protein
MKVDTVGRKILMEALHVNENGVVWVNQDHEAASLIGHKLINGYWAALNCELRAIADRGDISNIAEELLITIFCHRKSSPRNARRSGMTAADMLAKMKRGEALREIDDEAVRIAGERLTPREVENMLAAIGGGALAEQDGTREPSLAERALLKLFTHLKEPPLPYEAAPYDPAGWPVPVHPHTTTSRRGFKPTLVTVAGKPVAADEAPGAEE